MKSFLMLLYFVPSLSLAREVSQKMDFVCSPVGTRQLMVGLSIEKDLKADVKVVIRSSDRNVLYASSSLRGKVDYYDNLRDIIRFKSSRLELNVEKYRKTDKYKRGTQISFIRQRSDLGDVEANLLLCEANQSLTWDSSAQFENPLNSERGQMVGDVAEKMGRIAKGYTVYRVAGNTVKEMIEYWAAISSEEKLENLEFKWDSEGIDGEMMAWGTTTFKATREALVVDGNDEGDLTTPLQKEFDRLKNVKGLSFSWNPNDFSYCGTTFASPAIVDVENRQVIVIHMGESGGC